MHAHAVDRQDSVVCFSVDDSDGERTAQAIERRRSFAPIGLCESPYVVVSAVVTEARRAFEGDCQGIALPNYRRGYRHPGSRDVVRRITGEIRERRSFLEGEASGELFHVAKALNERCGSYLCRSAKTMNCDLIGSQRPS